MSDLPIIDVDPAHVSFELPGYIHRRIGRAIVAFSRTEHAAELIIWSILGTQGDYGIMITGDMNASRKFKLFREMAEHFAPTECNRYLPRSFWKLLGDTTTNRNKIAHGAWFMYRNRPAIMSTRLDAPAGRIQGEHFSYERLIATERSAKILEERLKRFATALGLPVPRQPPPRAESPIHPQGYG